VKDTEILRLKTHWIDNETEWSKKQVDTKIKRWNWRFAHALGMKSNYGENEKARF